ncbi:MAG: class I SAM-dependent methyltransferase [Acidimicrobiia bacterium]|nr:class I SAM-dependent methyltransferase [Acidimicrobiia bacterium]
MDPADPAYKGQSDYTPFLLSIYDRFVIGFMAPRVLRTSTTPLLDQYRELVGPKHLDVGPGTGWFLDHADLPETTSITLLDPNPNVLEHSRRVLARFDPTTSEADVLKPLPVAGPYDSAALNMVLHCLPGPPMNKTPAIRNVAAALADDGVLFGATVLGRSGLHSRPARVFLKVANRKGAFDNLEDSVDSLRALLSESFEHVEINTLGSAATFVARRPRR